MSHEIFIRSREILNALILYQLFFSFRLSPVAFRFVKVETMTYLTRALYW
jgi:hypothetical protein